MTTATLVHATLGTVSLTYLSADEEGSAITVRGQGGTTMMADGSIVYHFSGKTRYSWHLKCTGMTLTTYNTLKAFMEAGDSLVYTPTDMTGPFTVIVLPDTWKASSYEIGTATPYFTVEFDLEELS